MIGAGYLADKFSRTRLLTVLMVIWAITSATTGLVTGFIHLFFMRTALGAMTAVDDPASSSLLSDYYPAKIRHKAFSWRLVAPVVGGAFGNVSVGLAIDNWGWRWGFVVGAIPAAILIAFVARLPEPERGASDGEAAEAKALIDGRSWRRDLAAMRKVRSLPWLIGASAFGFGPAIGVTFWAPTFLRRHHDLTAGEAAGLFGFAALAGALLGGWIASRGPERFASIRHIKLYIAAAGAFGGFVLLMLAYSATPFGLNFTLVMLGAAGLVASGPILAALISEVTPASIRGSVFSVNTFCRLALSALAPLAIGFVADQVVFVDRDVPVAIVEDQAVVDRADRYECEDGRIVLEDDDPDPEDRANRNLYECGDEEVGHLGAGMVSVLAVGLVNGIGALRARRYLDEDIAANGGVPDQSQTEPLPIEV